MRKYNQMLARTLPLTFSISLVLIVRFPGLTLFVCDLLMGLLNR